MSFPRYPKYKDSGVEWLGEVPQHWEVKVLKHIVSTPITDGPHETPDFPDDGIPFVSAEAVATGTIDFTKIRGFISVVDHQRYSEKYRPCIGDVYMVKSGATTGVTAIVETDIEFNIWSPLAAIRCGDRALPRFVLNFMRSRNFQEGVTLNWSFGTQQNIGMRVIENLAVSLPPITEQTKIASFLDRETSKIDGLVGEQRRLIELLKEKRQAVISHAVTKGLNPHAPLKSSGIEWLGDVPEHWEVKPMRMIANVVRGASPRPAGDPLYFGGDAVPWVTVAEITKDDLVDLTETETFLTEEGACNSKLFMKGTVIYSNSGATLGVPKILRIDACANDGVVAFEKLSRDVHPQFLYQYLASITGAIREKVKQGSGQPNLNTDIVKALRFGLPPMDEQERIVGRIAELTDQFDALTAEAERGIDLLQERRTALISAAVTGQIDVRESS